MKYIWSCTENIKQQLNLNKQYFDKEFYQTCSELFGVVNINSLGTDKYKAYKK